MFYFSKKVNSLSLRNNLEKEIYKIVTEKNRLVIDESDIEKFKAKMISSIEYANSCFLRCKPLTCSWQRIGDDYALSGIDTINFWLYKSRN